MLLNHLLDLNTGYAIVPGSYFNNPIIYKLSLLSLNLSINTNEPISNVQIQLNIVTPTGDDCLNTANPIIYNSSSGNSNISCPEMSILIKSGEAFYISIIVSTSEPPNTCSIIVSSYSAENSPS